MLIYIILTHFYFYEFILMTQ